MYTGTKNFNVKRNTENGVPSIPVPSCLDPLLTVIISSFLWVIWEVLPCLNIHIYIRDIFWLFFPSFELVLRTIYYNKIFIAYYIWDLNTSWLVTLLDSYYVLRIYWNHREIDGLLSGLLSRAKVCFPEILALNTIGIFPLSSFTLLEWLSHICYWVKNFLRFIFTECVSFLTEFEFLVVTLHGVVKNFFPAY